MRMAMMLTGLCFLATVAKADFSGEWSGSGEATVNEGITVNCGLITLTLNQTVTELIETDGLARCALHKTVFSDRTYEIRGQALFLNNEQVGTLTDTALKVKYVDGASSLDLTLQQQDSGSASFIAEVAQNGNHYHVTGTLDKE